MNILFVCTGNTCRSPMAEALFRHQTTRFEVQSAGVFATKGALINEYAFQALQEKGIVTNHRSQEISKALLEWADLVFAMTKAHQRMLTTQYPAHKQKVYLLKDYAASEHSSKNVSNNATDIADPFGQDLAAYRETLSELDISIARLMQIIETGE